MNHFIKFIIKNILYIIYTILASAIFVLLFLPTFKNSEFVKDFLLTTDITYLSGITALILFFLIYSWRRVQNLCFRYKNTCKLEDRPFVYIDGIISFIIFSTFLVLLFEKYSIPQQSLEFKIFIGVNLIFILVWLISCFYYKTKNVKIKEPKIDKYSLSDEPIQYGKQEILGREKFIDDLYKEITNIPFDDSFVFGLYGSWGEGKTSVINLLIKKFNNNDNFLVVNFDPWYFKDEKAILTAFYRQIERTISDKYIFPDLKKTFLKYQKIILSGIAHSGINIDLSVNEKSLEEIKQKIESFISQINNKKILIIIDDIDRLEPNEILFILKTVRLNVKIKNTIFLLSFDPIIIKKYLQESDAESEFLEKIIQQPINLPAIEQKNIDEFLFKQIENIIDEIKISKEDTEKFIKYFSEIYSQNIKKLFITLRKVKNYLNGIRSTLPSIKREVNIYDFFILEVIRIFYPIVYNDIWRNRWYYIPMRSDDYFSYSAPYPPMIKDDEKDEIIREHIKDISKDEKNHEILIALLIEIFTEVNKAFGGHHTIYPNISDEDRAEKRISNPESFKKYFMLKVPSLEISDEFVETTIEVWESEEKSSVEYIIRGKIFELHNKDKLWEFFYKLKIFEKKINKDIALTIIKVIYKNIDKFSEDSNGWLHVSEYEYAEYLLLVLIDEKFEISEIQEILEEVITKTPLFTFAFDIVRNCYRDKSEFYNISKSVEIDKLKEKIIDRLKRDFIDVKPFIPKEIEDKREFFFRNLFSIVLHWKSIKNNNRKDVVDYIISLIEDSLQNFLIFLKNHRSVTKPQVLIDIDIIDSAYNLKEIKKIAENFKDLPNLTNEDKELINSFLQLYKERENKK